MKRLETITKVIGGTKFFIRPFGAFTSANYMGEIGAIVFPLLSALNITMPENQEDFNLDEVEVSMESISGAMGTLSGDKIEKLCKCLLVEQGNISYQDEEGVVSVLTFDDADELFCGDLLGMFVLIFEVIKVNYGTFFKKAENQFGKVTEKVVM